MRILNARDLAQAIRETLEGQQAKPDLGRWASLKFLDEDQHRLEFDPAHDKEMARMIFDLMVMEEGPEYYLDDERLRKMAEQLQRFDAENTH